MSISPYPFFPLIAMLVCTTAVAFDRPDGRPPLAIDQARSREPQPLKFLGYEGRLKTEPERIATVAALADVEAAVFLTQAYLVDGGEADRDKAIAFVNAWVRRYVPDGNPINEKELIPLILVYGALRAHWTDSDRKRTDHWLYDFADAQLRHRTTLNHRLRDNWNSKRVLILAAVAAATRNDYWWRTSRILLQEHISSSLYGDGSSFDFLRRDSLHYHISNVEPLVRCAILFQLYDGSDLYRWEGPHGASVARSVEFLLPYVRGEQERFDWRNSTSGFDHLRSESGDPEFRKDVPWRREEARALLSVAAWFDPGLGNELPEVQTRDVLEGWFARLARACVASANQPVLVRTLPK